MIRSVQKQRLSRRRLLRGVGVTGVSVSIGLPVLDIMLNQNGTALAAGEPLPLRFGLFFWGLGFNPKDWVPPVVGPTWGITQQLSGFAGDTKHFPAGSIENLHAQGYLTLLTGFAHPPSSPGHIPARGMSVSSSHDNTRGIAGVGDFRGQSMPEPSVDSIVAEAFKGQTPFDWLGVRISNVGIYPGKISWRAGGTEFNYTEPDPFKFFDRVFGAGVPSQPTDAPLVAVTARLKTSVLDVVQRSTQDLQAKLGTRDRQRLEAHLESIRSLEKRLQDRVLHPEKTCTLPSGPAQTDFGSAAHEEKHQKSVIMSELLATALACDLTRVFGYEWSATQPGTSYWEVNAPGDHHEQYSHGQSYNQIYIDIVRFIHEHYAYFAQQLKKLPEGDGNVLDNTLILATSEHGDSQNHAWDEWPFVFAGKAGGRMNAGAHYRHAQANKNVDAKRVLLGAVRSVGVQRPGLGQRDSDGERYTEQGWPDIFPGT